MRSSLRVLRALITLALLLVVMALVPAGCSCSPDAPPLPPPRTEIIACRTHTPRRPVAPGKAPGTPSVPAGTIQGTFGVTSTGEATYTLPLVTPPGRAAVEPHLSIVYNSASGDGIVGVGFSIEGLSAITRCPKTVAQDGEIRGVRYDGGDPLCLDGKRLVVVGQADGIVELRTLPDTFVKVLAHLSSGGSKPAEALSFEVHLPSGLTLTYGGDSGTPLGPKGAAPRAWLATKARDLRGNAMTYSYCFAEADGYTAEYAIDAIRYTSFEGDGAPALPASRAVQFVYGTKEPEDLRTLYSGGMALQSSLRLDAIEMLGPGDALVRRYAMSYDLGPTTKRTRLTQLEECASDGVCKPPTRFSFTSHDAGFKRTPTILPTPTSKRASPMLADLDGDGRDDLLLPDMKQALSTAQNPITEWTLAHNHGQGASGSPAYFSPATLGLEEDWPRVLNPINPSDPKLLQPELGTVLDYNHDGLKDVLVHEIYDTLANWHVLLGQPDHTFKLHDTGILRPFPLGVSPPPPSLSSAGASAHLADLDGDGVPDLITCRDHSDGLTLDLSALSWRVHLWKPAHGETPAGFDPNAEPADEIAGLRCDSELYTLDLDADGKVELIVNPIVVDNGTTTRPFGSYQALRRGRDGRWEMLDTQLSVVNPGGRVVFLDVNGDGLPDAVESGSSDGRLFTYLNTGSRFSLWPIDSVPLDGLSDKGKYFGLAVPLDFNGDGRQDLLLPVPGGTLPDEDERRPSWAILQATGALKGPTFTYVDPHIPFEAELGEVITLADPHGPRTGDVNGDGAEDVILPLDGVFNVFENLAADQDLLAGVSDGMNAHDPTDPGFVPNVSVAYGHLTDDSITNGAATGDPASESALYLSHADAKNDCAYPVRCVVGPRRVVRGYALNNGADGLRRFGVRYRDGRYHRLGRGFLGFAERIVTDLDTGSGTADFYDLTTFDDGLKTFPFAGQIAHAWRFTPGLPTQPKPEQIALTFIDVTRTLFPTNGSATYFTLPTERRFRREEGRHASGAALSVEAYVEQIAASGGATVLEDSLAKASDVDPFGNVRVVDHATGGVDLTHHVERTFLNDTDRWVLGKLATEKECSTASGLSRCRTLQRTTTPYGEVDTDTFGSDDGSPDTVLKVRYTTRDMFGNVVDVTADDAYGNHRTSHTTYDPEGLFPTTFVNAVGHTTVTEFDAALGVMTKLVDPNKLVTEWKHDGFGRPGLEIHPDGSQTTVTLSRFKDGGPSHDAWCVRQRTTTTGGADDTIELDSRGRPIRAFWFGPATPRPNGQTPPRLMQEIVFDALGEYVAKRSVPASEDTPESALLVDVYARDALGRELSHTSPWSAVTTTSYEGSLVTTTDPLTNATIVELDPLGRPITVTDAEKGMTRTTYGPFNTLFTVTAPDGAVTRTTPDAWGRVQKLDEPDRGTTSFAHNGFGELVTSIDALWRIRRFWYDGLGRPTSHTDTLGAESLTTTWTWDAAPNGLGKLYALQSPDGQKTSTYNERGLPESSTLTLQGGSETFSLKLGYDDWGRRATITYPTPAGTPPFVVREERDAHGYVLAVRDNVTSSPFWRLTDVDSAGRFRKEVFGTDVSPVSTEKSYFDDKPRLKSIVTESGGAMVQNLAYGFDDNLNLTRRSDALQPQNPTERFRLDALGRLTCAYFSLTEDASVPCAFSYGYKPNGNLSFKSDVGDLFYDDPAHPHAVTRAGADSFGYDPLGNQTKRPGGMIVTYTPFDLPKTITQGPNSIAFGYDGDQQRIRKTTPVEETIYVGDLYERVTDANASTVEHRYYVHSPERLVAIVTHGGAKPGTRYVYVDHLGSIDALTDESGTVVEKRSYDPFGQRRDPVWGAPTPASFPSLSTRGFTGHESDDELGLVNMKGRIFDPKLGRFLTPDPIVQAPLSGQSWNPYTYVFNNPLAFMDPSGFDGFYVDDKGNSGPITDMEIVEKKPVSPPSAPLPAAGGVSPFLCTWPPPGPKPTEGSSEAAQVGAATAPIDVATTGSSSGYVPQPMTTAPEQSTASKAGDITVGAAEGLGTLAGGTAMTAALHALTFGGYSTYQLASAVWRGYKDNGVVGALNAVNPLYAIGKGVADTVLAVDRGDYREAGAAGATTVVLGVVTGVGAVEGVGALTAGEGAAAGAAAEAEGAAAGAAREGAEASVAGRAGPGFVVTPKGEAIRVPTGATGPTPTRAPGMQYTGGSGGHGLDKRVTGVRIMEGNANQDPRVVYMNERGQTVDPVTGRTVANSDPSAHHYLKP